MDQSSREESSLHWLASGVGLADRSQPVLLDIGDGDAGCLARLAPSLPRTVVLARNPASAREARQLVQCGVVVGKTTAMPIASRSLLSIGCLHPFELVVDKETTCREWLRTVRTEGAVLVLVRLTGGHGQRPTASAADWCAYFNQRGLCSDSSRVEPPSGGADNIVYLSLHARCEGQPGVLFSGPFSASDAERLVAKVEERLSRRRKGDLKPTPEGEGLPAGASEGGLPLAPYLDHADIGAFDVLDSTSAPLFVTTVGGRAARLVKTLLNLPLRVLGRPQGFFNRMVRDALCVCLRVLREVTGFQRLVRDELTIQRAAVDQLVDENTRLRGRIEQVEETLDGVLDRLSTTEAARTGPRPGAPEGDDG